MDEEVLVTTATTATMRKMLATIMLRSMRRGASKGAVASAARDFSVCGAKGGDGLPKYEGHYPLDLAQRMFLGPVSAVSALLQPTRGDMVATLGEVTGTAALRHMLKQMKSEESGRQILQEKPVVSESTVDTATLIKLPEDTMGHQYARYMLSHG